MNATTETFNRMNKQDVNWGGFYKQNFRKKKDGDRELFETGGSFTGN